MAPNIVRELIFVAALIALAVLLANPFGWWMPDMIAMTAVGLLFAVFVIFAIFLWRERPEDEREVFHRMLAGRAAFLAGSGVLVLGILVQTVTHALDAWLVWALVAMLLGKVAAFAYGRWYH